MGVKRKQVFLFRHGETNLNVLGITMGQKEGLNTYFTEKGYDEISFVREELINNNIEVIYCSDFDRTMDTAKIANEDIKLPIYTSKCVRGLNMGIYQGLLYDEFINSPEVKMCFTFKDIKFPGGESINDLISRLISFIIDVCNNTEYDNIAVISHSAAISNLRAYVCCDSYISVKMCSLLVDDGKISVLDYIPVSDNVKRRVRK